MSFLTTENGGREINTPLPPYFLIKFNVVRTIHYFIENANKCTL